MLRWMLSVLIGLLLSAPAAFARDEPGIQTREAALLQDAGEYARSYDVPLAEAVRRLAAQGDSVPAIDALAARYRARLAGIFVQHRPDYRFVIVLTGTTTPAPTLIRAGASLVPVTFRSGATATRERVLWALTNHQAAIREASGIEPSLGIDPRTGELVVVVGNAAARAAGGADTLDARIEALTGVPVQIRVFDRVDRNLSVPGGGRLDGVDPESRKRYRCTGGFAVTDGVRHGIATAAHCLDQLSDIGPDRQATPLAFVGQWGWGYHDVQIHTGPTPDRALFYADKDRSRLRPVQAQRTKASTRAGDFVCHRGESTGYSCAEVELLDFAPAGQLCGGYCLPTWIAVAGPTCKGGDSGGPVFSGTTAFGIVKGATFRRDGSCAFYFYMSLDYLPAPWSLAIDPGTPLPPPPPVAPMGTRGIG
ncbi:hypothetical protein [Sphingomonas turrisvirgatae]|uniref:Peptidase S1 domain-containing protein n=1 Tax=Sphingomonas turrisvirgatae TaxID=1888892 RepID=A0A1E3LRG6_9SPHN|nr:hypothetical protein [Sphingomonas turrisvirgatae]ODP36327.1 hypothetical protein BFL28_06435 [Sphingomonas turrisvirgatae]